MRILWAHLYGDVGGVLGLFSGARPAPGSKRLDDARSAYFDYPAGVDGARGWCSRQSRAGREVYFCAHLLVRRRRIKENAAPLLALYVDGDGAKPAVDMPAPTAVVESSPGREQFYFRLTEPVPPAFGERLNRRLALAMVADDSGWDLTQLLRPPGTRNRKYPQVPAVRLIEINGLRHDPGELDRLLPPGGAPSRERTGRTTRDPRQSSRVSPGGCATSSATATAVSTGAARRRTWPRAWRCSTPASRRPRCGR